MLSPTILFNLPFLLTIILKKWFEHKDIVDNPIEFHRILHYLFGSLGVNVEDEIIDEFRRRFNIRIENGTLADYINRIRGMKIEKISSSEK